MQLTNLAKWLPGHLWYGRFTFSLIFQKVFATGNDPNIGATVRVDLFIMFIHIQARSGKVTFKDVQGIFGIVMSTTQVFIATLPGLPPPQLTHKIYRQDSIFQQ